MSNPAFSNMPAFTDRTLTQQELEELYRQPAAQKGVERAVRTAQAGGPMPTMGSVMGGSATPMTYENTIQKTAALFGVLLLAAVVGWNIPLLALPGALVGLGLALVIAFKKQISVPLFFAYAVAEGLFVGGISGIFNAQWAGIVFQAVLGTLIVFGVTLALFRSGKIRASAKMNKIALIALIGYAVFSLVNFGLMMFGVIDDPWGLRGVQVFGIPLGVIIGVFAIGLAAYCLVMDFDFIQRGVENQLDQKYGWMGAYGLLVTLVWLYLEILRLLAILRGNE
ncbi:Bax inhibitor-1/YccA family protein [Canibacter oris]|uniref:Putative YccA/Bax inhibitor family protein n=1 Tax=Canibacter oris TaxID=1365628 RepID=A0A840DF54_9MICO|nr:Bax inhibitor-1/YccA family protein [Canibacter oris]MBB4071704.1 putative YccA/Bax inhibitor family protein [Canibacter oris]